MDPTGLTTDRSQVRPNRRIQRGGVQVFYARRVNGAGFMVAGWWRRFPTGREEFIARSVGEILAEE